MLRTLTTLIVFSLFAIGWTADSSADGLIRKLPADGMWASYNVETIITDEDGSQTSSTGTLIVRSVGKTELDGKKCMWLEFEHNWEQEVNDKNSRRFHSSITKIAIDESVFSENADPTKGILAGFCDKTSADQKPEKWKYTRVHKVKPGHGSVRGFGALDFYVRAPFEHSTEIGRKKFSFGGETLDCAGIEQSETTHKLGADKNTVTTTAFRRWASDDTPFGVVRYEFERFGMDGTSFNQQLTLKSTGKNANATLPNAK